MLPLGQEIEIEFKNLLTKEEFSRLISHFSIKEDTFITQKNHYFDTPQFDLKEKKSALRIREKNDEFIFTLKTPLEKNLLETNQLLTRQESDKLLKEQLLPEGEVKNSLLKLGVSINFLQHFGTLTTSRAEVDYKDGLLVFDVSSYLNKVDYELEYEVKNRNTGEEIFLDLLKELKIPVRNTDNKVKRFYQEKQKQGK